MASRMFDLPQTCLWQRTETTSSSLTSNWTDCPFDQFLKIWSLSARNKDSISWKLDKVSLSVSTSQLMRVYWWQLASISTASQNSQYLMTGLRSPFSLLTSRSSNSWSSYSQKPGYYSPLIQNKLLGSRKFLNKYLFWIKSSPECSAYIIIIKNSSGHEDLF